MYETVGSIPREKVPVEIIGKCYSLNNERALHCNWLGALIKIHLQLCHMLLCPGNLLQWICTGADVFRVESLSLTALYTWPFTAFSSYFHQNVIKFVICMLIKYKSNLMKGERINKLVRTQRGIEIESLVRVTLQSDR